MRNKRRRLWIDHSVQGGIALRLTVYWMCSLVVAFSLMVMVQCILDPQTPFFTQLAHAKTIIFPIVAAFLLMLPVVIRDFTRMTNRFVGPVYRLRKAMSELRDGKFRGELKFRDNDYWQDMAGEFNQLARHLIELEEITAITEFHINEQKVEEEPVTV